MKIDYQSKKSSSGIYSRIFGELIGSKFVLRFDKRGHLLNANGLSTPLKNARNQLPNNVRGTALEDLVDGLSTYLTKPIFLSFFEYSWIELPEKPLHPGSEWNNRSRTHEMFIKTFGLFSDPDAQLSRKLRVIRTNKKKMELHLIPVDTNLYNWTLASSKSPKDMYGTIELSKEHGTKHARWSLVFEGGKEGHKAQTTLTFRRKPLTESNQ